jgi:xanthine dehydrogenase YagT iron-sulfur-binding subunit
MEAGVIRMKKEPSITTPAQSKSGDSLSDAGPVDASGWRITRRVFVTSAGILTGSLALGVPLLGAPATSIDALGAPAKGLNPLKITVNGHARNVLIDSRVTLLDLLREDFGLTGTKKGCDHGQCGACTVLSNGRRINSCLSLAVVHDGDKITTIEGLADGDKLHPLQVAFLEHDGLQCGYCTPGQICSAAALLTEHKQGDASFVTANFNTLTPAALTADEIRERMSGNICRCGAYPGIVAAVQSIADAATREARK